MFLAFSTGPAWQAYECQLSAWWGHMGGARIYLNRITELNSGLAESAAEPEEHNFGDAHKGVRMPVPCSQCVRLGESLN